MNGQPGTGATPYESADAGTQSIIRATASVICLSITVLSAALTATAFLDAPLHWVAYPLVAIFAASVLASIFSLRGSVAAGAISLISAIEAVIIVVPFFLLRRADDLHVYVMTATSGFFVNMLLAGLFAPRPLIIALTGASVIDFAIVAELTRDPQVLTAAPFLGTGFLVGGALAFFSTTVFQSAVAVARMEANRSAGLREQLLHAQKMEAIGRLAGGIAHDFNNVLTAINGQTELLLLDDGLREEPRGRVVEVRRYVAKATGLIQRLMLFSRKGTSPASKPFDPREALAGLEKMLTSILGDDVHLSISAVGEPLTVPVDQGQFEQVVMNLVVNARDAMPEGGSIEVAVRLVQAGQAAAVTSGPLKPGKYAALSVRDTGSGMDEEIRSRLFEPFFTTKPEGKGTGLGLSTVYGIVTRSGGAIEVSTAVGLGSTFIVYLPCA